MRGRWAAIGTLVVALTTVGLGSGCSGGGCDVQCADAPAGLVVIGTVTAIGTDGVVRFELDDGQQLDVLVQGRLDGLFEDVRYRVPLFGAESGPPTASMPDDCGCGPFITLPDGSEVRVAEPSVELRTAAAAVVGGAALVVALWAAIRWRRGQPL